MDDPKEKVSKKSRCSAEALLPWVMLFAVWVILSGKLDAFHLGAGVLTVLGLIWLNRGLQPLRGEDDPRLRMGRLAIYLVWLFKEMLQSAWFVAKEILKKDIQIEPQLIYFEADQPTVLNAVIFGHSITLTPGTITLDLENNHYLVHALTHETARGVLDGTMSQRVARLSVDSSVAKPRALPKPEVLEQWS